MLTISSAYHPPTKCCSIHWVELNGLRKVCSFSPQEINSTYRIKERTIRCNQQKQQQTSTYDLDCYLSIAAMFVPVSLSPNIRHCYLWRRNKNCATGNQYLSVQEKKIIYFALNCGRPKWWSFFDFVGVTVANTNYWSLARVIIIPMWTIGNAVGNRKVRVDWRIGKKEKNYRLSQE